jgi:hypothetical protein
MSPEQAKGMTVTGASDIFSLGVLFYQLLTGKLPFTGENLAAIMYQASNTDPEPADMYNQDVSREVLDILNKALEKDPEDRFRSAKEMADALRELVVQADTADLSETEGIAEDGHDRIAETSIRALQQVPGAGVDQDEPVDFEDLEQVLRDDTISGDQAGAPYVDTEDLPKADSVFTKRIDTVSEAEDTKLDLSELREVLAARKRRLADGDGQATEPYKQAEAAEDREQESPVVPSFGLKKERRFPSGRLIQGVYLAVTVLALAGAYYYFWHSEQADNRAVKILYYKYFGSKPESSEAMLEKQRQLVQQIMKEKLLQKQSLQKKEQEAQIGLTEKSSAVEETQKEQQRIIQEKIEEARRKEQARLAEIEAEKQKERERLARIEAEKQKERERLKRIEAEKKKAKEAAERRDRNRIETLILGDLKNIENLIKAADEHRTSGGYVEAKAALEKALAAVHASQFKDDYRLSDAEQKIKEALSSDEIEYGAKGYVLYDNQWLSPQEYENRLYSEGYVKYKNEFNKYQTLTNVITGKTKSLVNSFLSDKFKDQRVHTTNVNFIDLSLKNNSSVSSEYEVLYRWKVWTFKGLNEGSCTIVVSYDVAKDKWYLIRGCE